MTVDTQELRELLKKSSIDRLYIRTNRHADTGGKRWGWTSTQPPGSCTSSFDLYWAEGDCTEARAQLVVTVINALPALLDEIDALRERLEINSEAPGWDGIACRVETIRNLERENDALRARVAQLSDIMETDDARQWQPIETAPKDGTEILAWRHDCGQLIASYTSPSAFPLTQAELDEIDEATLFADDWFTQWPQAMRLDGSEAPTHWMPLPPAPPQGDGA